MHGGGPREASFLEERDDRVGQNYTVTLPSDLSAFSVVLVATSHPGNIGASARAMKTMGLSRLVLVSPRHFPDAQATALAAGASDVLLAARVVPDLASALVGSTFAVGFSARGRGLAQPVQEWRSVTTEALDAARGGEVALVFGNETSGLSNDELLACHRHATFAANPAYPSLNLAAAVQIACYELACASSAFTAPAAPARNLATASERDALRHKLLGYLVECGFLDPSQPGRLDERMRRLAARLDLESEEVALLHGMLDALRHGRKTG